MRFSRIRTAQAAEESLLTTPHGKHLENGDHVGAPAAMLEDQIESGELIVTSKSARRAMFHQRGVAGWYRNLANRGRDLPDIGPASWYVDVYVQTIGYLGTFRRSRQTGLWFSGRHSLHIVGN